MGDLGALNFNTAQQHLHTVFPFGLHLHEKGKEICDRAYCHHRKKQQVQSRVQLYGNKVSQACSPPPSLSASVYLSAALMRFHENSETEQVGVVAPGVGTTKLNREEAVLEDFLLSVSLQPATARRFKVGLYLCTHVALHMCKQINTANAYSITHINTLKNEIIHIKADLFDQNYYMLL